MGDVERLRTIMRALRDPSRGCPWDREQTFASIVPHTLEEAYEVADAIESGALDALPGELGDLLFQVVFYCQLGEEGGLFDWDTVVAAIAEKLVERHPHVFADARAADAEAVTERWEAAKAAERRRATPGEASELDDVPLALPALTRARKLQRRAARVGFDWPDAGGAWAKIREELDELAEAAGSATGGEAAIAEECGDLLFAVVNLARHLDCDPEAALRAANAKFERRFRSVESALAERGERAEDAGLDVLDALWDEAKQRGL